MGIRAEFNPIKSRDSSTFDNTYQTLGSAFDKPAVIVKIVNNSNKDIEVSTDGTTHHDFVPANGFSLYDIRTNRSKTEYFSFRAGTQFYIKGAAAGTGNVYLISIKEDE